MCLSSGCRSPGSGLNSGPAPAVSCLVWAALLPSLPFTLFCLEEMPWENLPARAELGGSVPALGDSFIRCLLSREEKHVLCFTKFSNACGVPSVAF